MLVKFSLIFSTCRKGFAKFIRTEALLIYNTLLGKDAQYAHKTENFVVFPLSGRHTTSSYAKANKLFKSAWQLSTSNTKEHLR